MTVIDDAMKWALEETKRYGSPTVELLELPIEKAKELAKLLDADIEVCIIGATLMDIKLGLCLKEGRIGDHVKESVEAVRDFLDAYELSDSKRKMILQCVESHHGVDVYDCIEAEICANADCYKFLHPRGVFSYISLLGRRIHELDPILDQLEAKVDEKWNTLSLREATEELTAYHNTIKDLVKKSRTA